MTSRFAETWVYLARSPLLWLSGTPYPRFFEGAQFVHFLLGPAIVALALPLHRELHREQALAVPLSVALLAGSAACRR